MGGCPMFSITELVNTPSYFDVLINTTRHDLPGAQAAAAHRGHGVCHPHLLPLWQAVGEGRGTVRGRLGPRCASLKVHHRRCVRGTCQREAGRSRGFLTRSIQQDPLGWKLSKYLRSIPSRRTTIGRGGQILLGAVDELVRVSRNIVGV